MLKANGHIAVWWFLCVCVFFLLCLYWPVTVDSWRDIIFLWWFIYVICVERKKWRSLLSWTENTGRVKGKAWAGEKCWERKIETRRRGEGLRSCLMMEKESRQGGKKTGKEGGKKMPFYSLENLRRSSARFSQVVLKPWSRGHWIELAISCVSRHCNTQDCVDE